MVRVRYRGFHEVGRYDIELQHLKPIVENIFKKLETNLEEYEAILKEKGQFVKNSSLAKEMRKIIIEASAGTGPFENTKSSKNHWHNPTGFTSKIRNILEGGWGSSEEKEVVSWTHLPFSKLKKEGISFEKEFAEFKAGFLQINSKALNLVEREFLEHENKDSEIFRNFKRIPALRKLRNEEAAVLELIAKRDLHIIEDLDQSLRMLLKFCNDQTQALDMESPAWAIRRITKSIHHSEKDWANRTEIALKALKTQQEKLLANIEKEMKDHGGTL